MSSNGYVIPIDPSEFSHYAGYDPRDDEDNEGEEEEVELTEEEILFLKSQDFHSRIEPLLDRIPSREADIIHLYFLQGKRQLDIAEIFNMTQAAVSYRLARGIKRIKFLLEIPPITEAQLREDLPKAFPTIDVDILVGMWLTTCQSEVAHRLGLTQGRVRHRFFTAVEKLRELALDDSTYDPYADLFTKISSKRFTILWEVKLPQWSDRGTDELVCP